jgi:anthranilate phosphoribosyltransferase
MKASLRKLIHKQNLTREETHTLFSTLSTYPLEQQAVFITLLTQKNESIDELLGALDFLSIQTHSIDFTCDPVDIVGTGGDGLNTFNISTAASLLIASCDVYVAKHGGRSSSSRTGSTDVLEQLGIPIHDKLERCMQDLAAYKYTYLLAPLFNTAFKSFSNLRKSLNIPTVFNVLGPLLNPMKPKRQVIGVYRPDLLSTVTHLLKTQGSVHAIVVHSADGMDELSVSAPTHIMELAHGKISQYTITPQDVGLTESSLDTIIGGDAKENANIIRGIFEGQITDAKLDVVLLNSAAGLLAADRVVHLRDGVDMARMMIQSGKTAAFFNTLQSKGICI